MPFLAYGRASAIPFCDGGLTGAGAVIFSVTRPAPSYAADAWESAVEGSLQSNAADHVASRMAEEAPTMQASASVEIIDRLLQTELDPADRKRFQSLVRQRQCALLLTMGSPDVAASVAWRNQSLTQPDCPGCNGP